MDENATKNVIESALLAAGRPLAFDKIVEIFARKGVDVDRGELRAAIGSLADDYAARGIELREVASGFRIQVRSSMRDWLEPLFEERAPRYTRALLETLALVAYRQPITRAEIEEVRGVAVSSNIVRTLIERGWVRVVGHRDVPGKPSMLGTTREFLDYFGLKRLEDLPPLSELRNLEPGSNLQSDLIDRLEERASIAAEADFAELAHDPDDASVEPGDGIDAIAERDDGRGAIAGPGDGVDAIAERGERDDVGDAVLEPQVGGAAEANPGDRASGEADLPEETASGVDDPIVRRAES